jgi:alpha-tubulin suppressor-like RCC1 family protein
MFLSQYLVFKIVLAAVTGGRIDYPVAGDLELKYDTANKIYLSGGSLDYVDDVTLHTTIGGETTSYDIQFNSLNLDASNEQILFANDAEGGDEFGNSCDVHGEYAVVGASKEHANGVSDAGSVYVYHRPGNTWIQQAKLMASDGQATDMLGGFRNLAIYGDTVVVGARDEDTGGSAAGSAYVFVRSGTTWSQQAILRAGNAGASDQFATGVAIYKDTIVIGAPTEDTTASDAGSLYVFTRSGTTWTQRAQLQASNAGASDRLGDNVSIDGDTIIAGAYPEDTTASDAGSAYIFTGSGATWAQQAQIQASDAAATDNFGYSVSISGNTVVVGSRFDDDGGSGSGSAYVFVRSGTTWTQQAKLTASDAAASDDFGWDVDIDKDHIVVAAYGEDTGGSAAGAIYVFSRSGSTWTEVKKIQASNPSASDYLGYGGVGIHDGTIITSSPNEDTKATDAGAAYIYGSQKVTNYYITDAGKYSVDATIAGLNYKTNEVEVTGSITPAKSWKVDGTETQILYGSDPGADDNFGYAVAVDGNYAVVGSRYNDTGGTDRGAAFIFHKSGGTWTEQAMVQPSDTADNDWFGRGAAISGDYVIVNAYAKTTNNTGQGAAYIFYRSGTSWAQQAKLNASDSEASDAYSYSVDIDGDYAIVGSLNEDPGGTSNAGSAYIYVRSGTSWSQQAKIQASDKEANDTFGRGVTISGDYAAVGADNEDTSGSNAGSVYIFKRSGTNWSQQQKIQSSDIQADDYFGGGAGQGVSLSGDTLAVGARKEDTGGSEAGSVYIFKKASGSETWSQEAKLQASDVSADSQFGMSVSLSGDILAVGANQEDTIGTDAGAAYIFERSGTTWTEVKRITASDGQANDYFGESISTDGTTTFVGAFDEDTKGTNAGAVYMFEKSTLAELTFDNYNKLSIGNAPTNTSSKLFLGSNVYDIGTLTSNLTIETPGLYKGLVFDTSSNVAYFNKTTVGAIASTMADTNAIPDFISFDTYNKLSLSGITNPTSKIHALPTGAESTTTYDIGTATNIYIESAGTYTAEIKGATNFALSSNVVGAVSQHPTDVVPSLTFDGFNKYTFTGADTGSTYKLKYESNTYDLGTISNVYIANPGTYSAEIKGATNFALSSNVVGAVSQHPTDVVPSLTFDTYNKLTFSGLDSGSTSNVTFDGNTYSIGTASNVYIENTGTYDAESKGTTTFALTSNVVGAVSQHPTDVVPSLTHDGYKLVVKNITPTSTTLKYFSNTYDIGSATNIYVKDTGAYTAEIGSAADFAFTSNTVSGTIKTVEPGFASRYQGSMALTYDGKLYAWGMNNDGEAGVGTSSDITVPTLCTGITQGTVAKLLSSSDLTDNSRGEVSYVKTIDGKIYATGKGDNFVIPGTTSDLTSFTDVTSYFGDQSLTANNVTMMSFTSVSGAALTETGNVWTWGTHSSTLKALGQASASSSSTPKQINFSSATDNITKITCGSVHSLALDSSGDVWFWGKNTINSDSWPSSVTDEPQKVVDGKNIIGIASSYGTMFSWDATGKMWNAGNNWEGHIGDGTTTSNSSGKTLTEVTYFSSKGITINKVYGGGYFEFADTSDGYYCWGGGNNGVFGNGGTGNITSGPAKWTNVSNIKKFMVSTNHATAITEDGKYYAWGGGANYARGDNTTGNISYPKYIDALPNILAPSFDFDGYNKLSIDNLLTATSKIKKDGVAYDVGTASIVTVSVPGTYDAQLSQASVFTLKSATVPATSTTGLYTWAFHHGNFDNAYGDGDILTARDNGRFYADTPAYTSASIGTITPVSSTTSNTTYTFASASALTANVMMVSGGAGGGGRAAAGGGGAGGLVYTAGTSLASGATKTIVVGNGDSGGYGEAAQNGYDGKDTTFTGLTPADGGGGGGNSTDGTGVAGGSGGGGGGSGSGGAAASGSQGTAGGSSSSGSYGGGGGGAGAAGSDYSGDYAGDGGIGKFFGTGSSFTDFGDEYGEGGYFAGGGAGGSNGAAGKFGGTPGRGGGGYGGNYYGYMGIQDAQHGGSQHALPHTGSGGGGSGSVTRDSHPGYDAVGDGGVKGHGGRGGSGIVLIQTNVAPPNGGATAVVQVGNPRRRSLPPAVSYMGSEVNRFSIIDGASMPTYKLPTHWYVDQIGSNSNSVFSTQGSHSLQKRADGGTSNVFYVTSTEGIFEYGNKMAQSADAIFMPVEQQRYNGLLAIGSNSTNDIHFEMAADGTAKLYRNNGATLLQSGTITCFTVGKWHHIALTVDSGGNAVGYVNGYPVVSGTHTSVAAVGSRSGNMHMRVGDHSITFRKHLTYEVSTYNFHMSPKQVLQRAAEVGCGPKLEYDGLNTIKILNTEPGSSVKLFTSNVADTSNVFIVADPATGEYTVPEAGKYYAEIKGTETFTITRTIDADGPLYQYPPVVTGTKSSLTTSLSADTWNTWTMSGASTGNGQYQAKTSHTTNAPGGTHATAAGLFTNLVKIETITEDGTTHYGFLHTSQLTNFDITLQLPSAKIIRKYVLYPADTNAPVSTPGGSVDPTLPGNGSEENTRRPKSWVLKGSANGSDWTDLDTVTNKPPSIYGDVHTVSSPASYLYYRLSISVNNGSSSFIILGEWQLWGDA